MIDNVPTGERVEKNIYNYIFDIIYIIIYIISKSNRQRERIRKMHLLKC